MPTCKELGLEEIELNSSQIASAEALLKYCDFYGIKNPVLRNAILVICFKESKFKAKVEFCYNNTSNSRIRGIFGNRVAMLTEAQLTALKKDCIAFFDKVYGKEAEKFLGFKTLNDNKGDGYRYRGRGFNGITFKVQYRDLGKKLGVDLVTSPQLLEKTDLQAKASILYFSEIFTKYDKLIKQKFGASAKDITNYETALKLIYNINAGLGNNIETLIKNDTTDGWAIVQCSKNQIPALIGSSGSKFKPLVPILAGLFFLAVINPKWIKKNIPRSLKKYL
jgi:predicted chitinase